MIYDGGLSRINIADYRSPYLWTVEDQSDDSDRIGKSGVCQ